MMTWTSLKQKLRRQHCHLTELNNNAPQNLSNDKIIALQNLTKIRF